MPDLYGAPGRFLGRAIAVEIDGDGGAAAQPADGHQRVAVTLHALFFHAHGDHQPHDAVAAGLLLHRGGDRGAPFQLSQGLALPFVRGIFVVVQLQGGEAFLDAVFVLMGFLDGQENVDGGQQDELARAIAFALGAEPWLVVQFSIVVGLAFVDPDAAHGGSPLADGHVLAQIGHGVIARQLQRRGVEGSPLHPQGNQDRQGPRRRAKKESYQSHSPLPNRSFPTARAFAALIRINRNPSGCGGRVQTRRAYGNATINGPACQRAKGALARRRGPGGRFLEGRLGMDGDGVVQDMQGRGELKVVHGGGERLVALAE